MGETYSKYNNIMKLLFTVLLGALAQIEKFSDSERGVRTCQGVKVSNGNGVNWLCGTRGPQFKRKKKCRAKCDVKKEGRTGVKKISCKDGVGWVEKKTEGPVIDPSTIFCS